MNNQTKPRTHKGVSMLRQRVGLGQIPAPPPSPPPPPPKLPLSRYSTSTVEDSCWASCDFLLGVAMVIIQQNTHKIVLVYSPKDKYWFFPRGRKDIGETLEHAALREAYEESGYRAEFLPLRNPTRQPPPPENRDARYLPNVEPIYLTFRSFRPRKNSKGELIDCGGEYLTHWYAGQIPENAVKVLGTGMPDELDYESHLLTYEEVLQRVWGQEKPVVKFVWEIYQRSLRMETERQRQSAEEEAAQRISSISLQGSVESTEPDITPSVSGY